jgi:hypothetical protein
MCVIEADTADVDNHTVPAALSDRARGGLVDPFHHRSGAVAAQMITANRVALSQTKQSLFTGLVTALSPKDDSF